MSIHINQKKCVGCGRCADACPGSLIWLNSSGKAEIRIPEDCWGCTSCMKECPTEAISLFLGADIGGQGSELSIRREGTVSRWIMHRFDGTEKVISVDSRNANSY